MNSPKKRVRSVKYSPQLKIAIAQEYLNSDLGYKTLGDKHNIPATSVHDIVAWYKKRYPNGVVDDVDLSVKPAMIDDANLKIIALELLIENASKELGIDLVKKFGTKQQKG